jgi:hypothetical protein
MPTRQDRVRLPPWHVGAVKRVSWQGILRRHVLPARATLGPITAGEGIDGGQADGTVSAGPEPTR